MRKRFIPAAILLAAGAGAAVYAATSSLNPQRDDCPGQVVCPLTGELVCVDRCPLTQQSETDVAEQPKPAAACCIVDTKATP